MHGTSVAPRIIGVLLDRVDGLLAGFVSEYIRTQPDMQIVEESSAPVDVIVTSLTTEQPDTARRDAFFASTGVPLVAISANRRWMAVHDHWEVRVDVYDRDVVRDVRLEELIDAIRAVAQRKQSHDNQTARE